jgi:hypothetical protein
VDDAGVAGVCEQRGLFFDGRRSVVTVADAIGDADAICGIIAVGDAVGTGDAVCESYDVEDGVGNDDALAHGLAVGDSNDDCFKFTVPDHRFV